MKLALVFAGGLLAGFFFGRAYVFWIVGRLIKDGELLWSVGARAKFWRKR